MGVAFGSIIRNNMILLKKNTYELFIGGGSISGNGPLRLNLSYDEKARKSHAGSHPKTAWSYTTGTEWLFRHRGPDCSSAFIGKLLCIGRE